ncbi:fungal-specific transcription factor domain-containing protein [Podospora australis]|uniref:Fungal-specific transcription factor domain-containing protein n=1 Tax=Podospora australis TaxID=1536484 RepID=A0AAN6X1T3_9PEZI|nr:fungal-specific transcription factor domain-containing protein [Podospora australis]
MDRSFPVVSNDGNLQWSDNHSTDSDDIQSVGLPSPWLGTFSTSLLPLSTTMGFAHTGQLSPGDTESSPSLASQSQSPPDAAVTMAHSVPPSASAESWNMGYSSSGEALDLELPHGAMEHDNHEGHDHMAWEHDEDEILMAPKQEPSDDDGFCMGDIKEAPQTPLGAAQALGLDKSRQKRPRGRPRKHPLTPNLPANKVTKGRSKTGCLTCRKRKKKCDETKPRCMNCEKNAVVCEGYPEKQIWKSGRERAEEERLKSHSVAGITMQPLFYGLETAEDMVFWKHYNEHLSSVLTVEGEHKNAFRDMMVPLATKHQGLMHSILSLASKHIDFDTPYGVNVLRNNPGTTVEALRERSMYHHEQAREKFFADVVEFSKGKQGSDDMILVSARYGQMLCFLLEALTEGNPRGEHRVHLKAYRRLIATSPPGDSAFFSFIAEFFQYHIFADEMLNMTDPYSSNEALPPIPDIEPARLLGVADGLLTNLSEITELRNTIRNNIVDKKDLVMDYNTLYRGVDIEVKLKGWEPHWPRGDNRDRVGLLYKQMMWIYLFRTMYPPSRCLGSPVSLDLSMLETSSSTGHPNSSAVNTPPQSASTSCASSPRLDGVYSTPGPSTASDRQNSRPSISSSRRDSSATSTLAVSRSTSAERANSPPPIRRPHHVDPRVSIAVNESLAILESFKPSDPCQTLLLLPCFVVGTACFTPDLQDRVRAAIKAVRGYTGLRNTDCVLKVLEEVWRLMEKGDWEAVWDWAGVASGLGLDFIPA